MSIRQRDRDAYSDSGGSICQDSPVRSPQRLVRLVLVDDHTVLRQGLRVVLERETDFRIVGEAACATSALVTVTKTRPDAVLLDLELAAGPQFDGIAVCRRLRAAAPESAVLILTTFVTDRLVLDAMHAGARGYIVKDVDAAELSHAIRKVVRGGSAFDVHSSSMVLQALLGQRVLKREKLTERELEVLSLLARGLSNRAIGEKLFISETTVKFHVCNIMRKLSVTSRAEAVYQAAKRGLL